jgi:hypothetical protein
MAEIGEVLYTKLTGYAGLAALIGSRVYPGQVTTAPHATGYLLHAGKYDLGADPRQCRAVELGAPPLSV